jgi:hypothetical protein
MSGGRVLSKQNSVMTVQSNPADAAAIQGQNLRVENINDAVLISPEDLLKIIRKLTSVE